MTKEEAATILYKEWQRFLEDNLDYAGISDAYTMAINTLKQEPCEDCISRRVVKERMIKYGFHAPDMTVTEFVEDLPSVTSQPKTGHWNTYVVSRGGINEEWLECSECMWSNALVIPRNYCPNCGARMIESEE